MMVLRPRQGNLRLFFSDKIGEKKIINAVEALTRKSQARFQII